MKKIQSSLLWAQNSVLLRTLIISSRGPSGQKSAPSPGDLNALPNTPAGSQTREECQGQSGSWVVRDGRNMPSASEAASHPALAASAWSLGVGPPRFCNPFRIGPIQHTLQPAAPADPELRLRSRGGKRNRGLTASLQELGFQRWSHLTQAPRVSAEEKSQCLLGLHLQEVNPSSWYLRMT